MFKMKRMEKRFCSAKFENTKIKASSYTHAETQAEWKGSTEDMKRYQPESQISGSWIFDRF